MDGWPQRPAPGNRLWLDRATRPPPSHRLRAGRLRTTASVVGVLALARGLAWLAITPTPVGLLLAVVMKAWFADRMVWLHADRQRDLRNEGAPSA